MAGPKDPPHDRRRIFDEVRANLVSIGLDAAKVAPAASLADDLDLDSLDWADLAMQLEESFSIVLREDRLESLVTVQDLVDRIYLALLAEDAVPV